jgi:hypothetical protein
MRGNEDDEQILILAHMALETLEELEGDRRLDGCAQLDEDAVLLGQFMAKVALSMKSSKPRANSTQS